MTRLNWDEYHRLSKIGADIYWVFRRLGHTEEQSFNAGVAAAFDASLLGESCEQKQKAEHVEKTLTGL